MVFVAVLGSSTRMHEQALVAQAGVDVVAAPMPQSSGSSRRSVLDNRDIAGLVVGAGGEGWLEAVEESLDGGRRVLLLLPYLIDENTLDRLRRRDGKTPGLLSVSAPHCAEPVVRLARRSVREGQIGRARCVRILWTIDHESPSYQPGDPLAWAGILADLGRAFLDDRPARVAAVVQTTSGLVSLTLNVEGINGSLALLAGHGAYPSSPPLREIWVIGEKGAIHHRGDGGDLLWSEGRATTLAPPNDPVSLEVGAWLRAVAGGADEMTSIKQYSDAHAVARAAIAALENGQPVRIGHEAAR
ncbi:MAG: hypothetical protein ACR2PL_13655 [Dehalococcoidia bacterium]